MKNWLNNSLIIAICALAFISCEKDEVQAVLTTGEAPALTVTESTLVFTEESAEEEAAAFSWTAADFGYQAAVRYSLQFDAEGNDFSEAQNIEMGNSLDTTLTVQHFNTITTRLGLEPEVEQNVIVRVMAQVLDPTGVSSQVEPMYSNTETLSVTPYSTFIEPAFIYVPGAYNDWDPSTAASLISVEDNGIYEGYITFPEGKLEFKFTAERSWDLNYGQGDTEGSLSEGGANLSVPEPGTYQIVADLNTMTWTATPYSWGVIGDATPGGWDADTDMTFDSEERVWKLTTALTTGKIKFRLNDDWATNYGDDDTSDDTLNLNGADIEITEAGNYEIVLNLQDPENPTYSLTKL